MKVLHGLMSRPNVTTSMIFQILESCEDHIMWLTENGETFQSDELTS